MVGIIDILTAGREAHSQHRRLLSHAFSEKALREQEGILLTHINKLVGRLVEESAKGPVNIVRWVNFVSEFSTKLK